MPLLELIGRLGLDSAQFEQGLKKSEMTAQAFGQKFRRSIFSTVGSFFTLGYAINFVQDKIRKLEGEGDTTEVWEWDAADIEAQYAMIRTMEKQLETKKAIARLDDDLMKQADARFLKELSDEERRAELLRRRLALLQIIGNAKENKLTPIRERELRLEAGKLFDQITALDKDKLKPATPEFRTATSAEAALDPLARIGGFTGGADSKVVTIQERIARATEETADNTAANGVRFH